MRFFRPTCLVLVCILAGLGCDSSKDKKEKTLCGNSALDGSETCDDGNTDANDGCDSACTVEIGFECEGTPSICRNLDDCRSRPCRNGGECVDGVNSYTCDCSGTEYEGDNCETPTGDLGPHADCKGNINAIGDGYCDTKNNSEGCSWDGGDCCPSTCVNATYLCGGYVHVSGDSISEPNFNCLSPEACENTPEGCTDCAPGCDASQIGDGTCDTACWTASCQWDASDAGDPDCTCDDVDLNTDCDGYCFGDDLIEWVNDDYCDDGRYGLNFLCDEWSFDNGSCDDVDEPWVDPCTGYSEELADGFCDDYNNNEGCDYDGGDCCASECYDSAYPCSYEAETYSCQDPNACENDGSCECPAACAPSSIGDGVCNTECLDPSCNWDIAADGTSDCSCDIYTQEFGDTELGWVYDADCRGYCFLPVFLTDWVGDKYCDDGSYGIDLNCEAFQFDGGDCVSTSE